MVAKYFNLNEKNPIEEFNWFCSEHKINPNVETYLIEDSKQVNIYETSDEELSKEPSKDHSEKDKPENMPFINYKSVIYYQVNKELCTSYGNTRDHSKRNVCMLGLAKLREEYNVDTVEQLKGVYDKIIGSQNDEDKADSDAEIDALF